MAHSVVPNLASVHTSADEEIAIHANIHVDGKTQLWNRGAVLPGVKSLGVPISQPDHVRNVLEQQSREETLSHKILGINDPQAAWFIAFWLRG